MIVYELSFWYFDEEPEDEDEVIIAVYSSRELAEKAIEKFKTHPRFAGREDDFYISEYGLNEPEWRNGFYVPEPDEFQIQLSDGYVIQKYADDWVVLEESDGSNIFKGTFQYYDENDQSILFMNTKNGWKYCFDKKKKKIYQKTKEEDQLKEFLKSWYGIETIDWKLIFKI